jgi:ribosomal protein S18 acetylase RimI-like enzyme
VPLSVRRAHAPDYDAIADLTARVYLTEGFGSTDYEPALRNVAERNASAEVLVALREERVVGAVAVATRGGRWAEQGTEGEAVIRMLVVDPTARGAGVGAALVQACVVRAREDGCHLVRLSTMPEMTAAHRLYERLGFLRSPEDDWTPVPGVELLGYLLPLAVDRLRDQP